MAVAKSQIIIGAGEFIKGMSSGTELADGGFSTETEAVNLINTPGVVYAPTALVDGDGGAVLDNEIIASAPDEDESGNANPVIVVTADGDVMEYNGTQLSDIQNGQDTTRTYAKGFTDAVPYDGLFFFTSKEQLATWNGGTTFNFTYAAMGSGTVPHPLLVFENNLYIGDGNLLKRMTSSSATPATILTLATGETIQTLGIDPGNGKILISTTSGLNTSSTIPRVNKVSWYDGFSNKVAKLILVEEMVTVFHHHQGNVYVIYGPNVGLLTGAGIRFLRKLNITLDATDDPIWKHQVKSIGETMYIAEKTKVLAYGPIRQAGENVWYYAAKNQASTKNITCLLNAGKNKLGMGMLNTAATTGLFRTLDIKSVSSLDKLDIYTNWLQFPRPIFIREVIIETVGQVASSVNFSLNLSNERGQSLALGTLATQTSVYTVSFVISDSTDNEVNKCRAAKLRIQNSTENDGIRRIIIYYDVAE